MLIGYWNNGLVYDRNTLGHPQTATDSTGLTLSIRTRRTNAATCAATIPLAWCIEMNGTSRRMTLPSIMGWSPAQIS
ncbi:hypothetical protein FOQG_17098 [Fusarium oxysporum f. sp. raphani 54005]|uniref:Uncharacterized protein n=1 Tax=Fusarium oxysporum f. sp. raphani 54005 TaxID=1089458 RepID=X0C677_FUSOX|nr:hypothetical protein FOQG_17098 [Fusarium oxysporum f. sp. raphani 54005]